MKTPGLLACLAIYAIPGLQTQEQPRPFVEYPDPVAAYLKRIQEGGQEHAFDVTAGFDQWQKPARRALIKLTGLKRMAEDLAGFKPTVKPGKPDTTPGSFTRTLCSIETEPGILVPFYLLVPKDAKKDRPRPLLLCPHGHDSLGLHSYAGAFKDEKHRAKILAREGDIGAQAARRGFVVIAPATRGLAAELSVPDPKGRHGNRPCRAQLMHCLLGGRTPTAERVWDMQRLLDWAQEHPFVDPSRIVMTGNSGGGVLTAYTAAIDPRIRVAIPSCSFTSVMSKEGFIFHCDCCLVPGLRDWGDWKELGGLVAPRHLLIVHGVNDGLHHRPTVQKLGDELKNIFKTANVPGRMSLEWGNSGHRFYPAKMWPFIEKAIAEEK